MFKIIAFFLFYLFSIDIGVATVASEPQCLHIRAFDLGGGGLKTALFSYDPSTGKLEFVEPQVQLGVCPNEIEVADWLRKRMSKLLHKNIDDEVAKGYWFGFSIGGLHKLRPQSLHTADMAQLFRLPAARVGAIDDGAAHLLSSLNMPQPMLPKGVPIWNFSIGTGVGFGFTDSTGRVCRLSELCSFFDAHPCSIQEQITGKEVWIACGSKLGFDALVEMNGGVVNDAVFTAFALRWKGFLDSCLLRCSQKQVPPPHAIVFTGGHIDIHGQRMLRALQAQGFTIPLHTGMRASGLLGAAWNVVSQKNKNTDLIQAAKNSKNVDNLQKLITHGADVNASDYSGQIPLLAACIAGNVQGVEVLLTHGAEVNAFDFLGRTALYIAVEMDNFEMAEVLLTHGADSNKGDCWGYYPLASALRKGNRKIVELLRKHGAHEYHHALSASLENSNN